MPHGKRRCCYQSPSANLRERRGRGQRALSRDSSALQKITKAIAVVGPRPRWDGCRRLSRQAQHRLASAAMQLNAEPRVPVAAGVQQGDELQYNQASPLLFEHIAYRRRSSPGAAFAR